MNAIFEHADAAVRRFAADLHPCAPHRIHVELDGPDGMARLCAVEAAVGQLWPPGTAKELVWLTRTASAGGGVLRLRAFGPDGDVLGDASFPLAEPTAAGHG